MMRCLLAASLVGLVCLSPRVLWAQGAPQAGADEARADALFQEAKHLQEAGQVSDACVKFAESQKISPTLGTALHLADCHARLGQTLEAMNEFLAIEKLAHEKGDDRAAVARARAMALEPKLGRITIAVAPVATAATWHLQLDKAPLPPEDWNTTRAVAPGYHEITLTVAGRAPRTFPAQVEAGGPPVHVSVDDGVSAAKPAGVVAAAAQPAAPSPRKPRDARRYAEYALLAGGVLGVGLGVGLLAGKNGSMTDTNPTAAPQVNDGLAIGSKVAFAVGGGCFVSAVVLYLTAPATKEIGLRIAPDMFPGGGGGSVYGVF